jgi:subtilisin family serine protease
MTAEENPIISENYADVIIEYEGDKALLEPFQKEKITIINDVAALVNIPLAETTGSPLLELGYARIPSLGGLCDRSLEASGILRIRSIPNFDLRGQGVLIAIIDTGVDYTNQVFQNADKTTRITALWDQTIQSENPLGNVKFGTAYTREQINQALQSENPFGIVPSRDDNGHGTMVAGIAGGSEVPESNFAGVASQAEFVVVKLKQIKKYLRDFYSIPENVVCFQETDFLFALEFVLSIAVDGKKPLAICVSVNATQGSHDGRSMTGRYLSTVATRSGTGVVVAGGNEGSARRHFFGMVDPSVGYDTVELNVGENEKGFTMELWGQSPSIFTLDITSPSGEYVPRITATRNETREVSFVFEPTLIYINYNIVEAESGDQLILVKFTNPSSGIWKFNVYERGDIKIGFHIWLPMDDFITENTFFVRSDPYTTILAMGNAQAPVTVVAYNDADNSLYVNSSKGYTRIGGIKPNIAAPGVNITGPDLNHGFAAFNGTSVASAHTSGVVAMLLEWGIVRGNLVGMSTIEINKLFMRGARRETGITYPNRDWGYGILDIFNVFDSLRSGAV